MTGDGAEEVVPNLQADILKGDDRACGARLAEDFGHPGNGKLPHCSSTIRWSGPWHEAPHREPKHRINDQSHDPDCEHADDDDVGAQHASGVVDQEAEARIRTNEFGSDECHPTEPQTDSHPGHDLRQRRFQDHPGEDATLIGTEAPRRSNKNPVSGSYTLDSI